MKIYNPASLNELKSSVLSALENSEKLEITGLGSKSGLGSAVVVDALLKTDRLSGIEFYEPEELTIKVKAGTPLKRVIQELKTAGQQLPFEPSFLGGLYGQDPELGTIGGMIACNTTGPRRVVSGSVRDALMGIEAVSGFGEVFHSGGRVLKNVTGFDLVKLMSGAHGTLGVLHSATLLTKPIAESELTMMITGLSAIDSGILMRQILASGFNPTAAGFLPEKMAMTSKLVDSGSITLIRFEGAATVMPGRINRLCQQFSEFIHGTQLDRLSADKIWQLIRDVTFFHGNDSTVLRLSVPSVAGPFLLQKFTQKKGVSGYLDLAGSLLWLSIEDTSAAQVEKIRYQVATEGGHVTVYRLSSKVLEPVPFTHPQPKALADLSKRIRFNFDPHGVFNPGRLWPV